MLYMVHVCCQNINIFLCELKATTKESDHTQLTRALLPRYFKQFELRQGEQIKVRTDANKVLALHVFHIYYMRAICIRAIEEGKHVEWYRAKHTSQQRPSTNSRIGRQDDPNALLLELRQERPNLPDINSGGSLKLA